MFNKFAEATHHYIKAQFYGDQLDQLLSKVISKESQEPSLQDLEKIVTATYIVQKWEKIHKFIWQKLKNSKNGRKVLKSLSLIDFLVKNGPQCLIFYFKTDIYRLRPFQSYSCLFEESDRVEAIRNRATNIIALLINEEYLKEERVKAQNIRVISFDEIKQEENSKIINSQMKNKKKQKSIKQEISKINDSSVKIKQIKNEMIEQKKEINKQELIKQEQEKQEKQQKSKKVQAKLQRQQKQRDLLEEKQLEKALMEIKIFEEREEMSRKVEKKEESIEKKQKEDNECVICFERPREVIGECYHIIMCLQCSSKIKECPVCKRQSSWHKIYYS